MNVVKVCRVSRSFYRPLKRVVAQRSFASEATPAWMQRPYSKYGSEFDIDHSKDPKWKQMEEDTGIPADQLASPQLHHWSMRAEALLDELGIAEQDREKFLEDYTLSPGHFSLEWVLPSPPPAHCFTELPTVKDPPGEDDN